MKQLTSKTFSGFKYAYLIGFFMLLSGFFHPLITNSGYENVAIGVFVLLLGLAGALLIYQSAISDTYKMFLLGCGLGLSGIATYGIFYLTGRT